MVVGWCVCVVGGCVETTSFSLPEVHVYLRSGPAEDVLCVFDWHEMMPPPPNISNTRLDRAHSLVDGLTPRVHTRSKKILAISQFINVS